jgi:hypothetical protein
MKRYRVWKGVMFVVFAVVAAFLFGFITMQLWNWLMPAILGLHTITFWQALGLLVLSKILFGGFHRHSGGGGRRRMKEHWAQMSAEEREKFRSGMRGRGRGWCQTGPQRDAVAEAKTV